MPREQRPSNAGAVSVYFPDKALPESVKAELKSFPRSSFNGVMAQFLEQFHAAIKDAPRDNRKIQLDVTLWL